MSCAFGHQIQSTIYTWQEKLGEEESGSIFWKGKRRKREGLGWFFVGGLFVQNVRNSVAIHWATLARALARRKRPLVSAFGEGLLLGAGG